ncbi:EAL domain-containing protein [Sphingomonas sp. AR_OL41]|uniref:putative bifunctional diguanylate cyclase/phosphodiesterase n=1 Tax=Sphingomonas sp. AR_OL41 TaxID=3042729 RepID=UPI002480F88A|nr:EAL domain-containing protein [Sphingomonas sp. AR_OL41]MDH7972035.1 EAL domain-containing protein [Sphingomonas sp. AR_OL41]
MIAPLHPFRAIAGAAGGLRDDLVPGAVVAEAHDESLRDQVRQLSAAWPLVLLALASTSGLVDHVARMLGRPDIVARVMLHNGLIGALGLVVLIALKLPFTHRWSPHAKVRLATVSAAGIAVGLLSLLSITAGFPIGNYRLASFVAVFGTIIITVVALHPVRAATLGFATAMVATIGVQAGPGLVCGVGVAALLCLALATYRLARFDEANARQRDRSQMQGRMATRLIAEFESHSTGWFWQTDSEGRVTYLSEKVAAELDLPDMPAIGEMLTALFRVDSVLPETERTLAFHLSSRTAFSNYSVRPASASKLERWWSISGRPIADDVGRFQGFIGSGSDLTERRRADAEITRLALFDGLTGLANRQRMRVSLDQTLHQPGGAHRASALFLLDLDRFKAVNDTLGHQTGDSLLKQVAQRLQRSIGEAGLVGRLGGDEFEVILPGLAQRDRLAALATEVIAALSQPYFIDGSSITIGCSIGIAIAPEHGEDAEKLVRNADLALYAAKADGRGIHRFFREELLVGAQSRKELEDDLRQALAHNQFHVAYQPVVSTISERIVGYEALVRWNHPTRGAVSPGDFIPVAEECGLIESIGEWVLRTACLEAVNWPRDVRVAVNVSPIQFANPNLPTIVTNALARAGLSPGRLELEITEGVFLDDNASSESMFKLLKGIGVRLALDDFGTGYSSLGYLKKAPFDKIKIDQSFVKGAAIAGNRNAAIIKAIVTLADTLGMETTAEGVETFDQIELIRELGCSHIQGYVYGKPARAEDVAQQLTVNGGQATATGYRISRAPRTTMLRSAKIAAMGAEGEVRIRNMSSTGAMIDGIEISGDAKDVDIMIELLEDQMFPAKLRWAADGKAGLEFAQTFNLERLNPATVANPARKAG